MDLFLDDARDPSSFHSNGEWKVVRDYPGFVRSMSKNVRNLSLDDLSLDDKTGYDCVKWMEQNGVWPSGWILIHSSNPKEVARMANTVKKSGLFERDERSFLALYRRKPTQVDDEMGMGETMGIRCDIPKEAK